eukprot:scaffold37429_cov33-Tisochrysis_lutea.AAC.2
MSPDRKYACLPRFAGTRSQTLHHLGPNEAVKVVAGVRRGSGRWRTTAFTLRLKNSDWRRPSLR